MASIQMKVLITNTNIDFFKEINKDLKITQQTKNTSIIECTTKTFNELYETIKSKRLNPFALMTW